MNALIFDIDGTLIKSSHIDTKLYKEAIFEIFPEIKIKKDWSKYNNVTDEGILIDVFRDNKIILNKRLKNKIKTNFFTKTERYINESAGFVEFPGAKEFINYLIKHNNYKISYATGGWKKSAIMKLNSAGFKIKGIPLVSSDYSHIRTEIMKKALSVHRDSFKSITYYGDATWDRDAAKGLGWDFMPVGARLMGLRKYSINGPYL